MLPSLPLGAELCRVASWWACSDFEWVVRSVLLKQRIADEFVIVVSVHLGFTWEAFPLLLHNQEKE